VLILQPLGANADLTENIKQRMQIYLVVMISITSGVGELSFDLKDKLFITGMNEPD